MQQLKTIEIGVSLEALKGVVKGGPVPPSLDEPIQAAVTAIVSRSRKAPLSVYVCSADVHRELRDCFAYVLVKSLSPHLPNALLVDCDFLSVGLSGIVPFSDALGFLDLLLYGSSLGAIQQKGPEDVKVVGAGSFPVAKKSPFVMDTFENATRYLLSNAGCVVFCGPCLDDDEAVHPVVEGVALPIVVVEGRGTRSSVLDAVEDKVSSAKDTAVWSVRLFEPPARRERTVAPPGGPDHTIDIQSVDLAEILNDTDRAARDAGVSEEPVKVAALSDKGKPVSRVPTEVEELPPLTLTAKSGNSAFPRIITAVLAVVVIGFLVWWQYLTNSIGDGSDETLDQPPSAALESTGQTGAPAESLGEGAQAGDPLGNEPMSGNERPSAQSVDEERVTPDPPRTITKKPQPVTFQPPVARERGTVSEAENLAEFVGQYIIHVSSFKQMDNARQDAEYLAARGHSTIISQIDLGERGLWYRVYVGPIDSSNEAASLKKSLDEYPRVKSTRIQRVRG